MCKSIVAGNKWNSLECLESGSFETPFVPSNKFEEYDYKLHPGNFPPRVIEGHSLRCICGKDFTITMKDCPGKRALMDCGCGAGVGVGRRITVVWYAPLATLDKLDDYANRNRVSHVFEVAVRSGLKAMDPTVISDERGFARCTSCSKRMPEDLLKHVDGYAKSNRISRSRALVIAAECGLREMEQGNG